MAHIEHDSFYTDVYIYIDVHDDFNIDFNLINNNGMSYWN
jgi:hypothetical protein